MKELEEAYYEAGIIDKFNKVDRHRFKIVKQFQDYLRINHHPQVNLKDPCTWSLDIWSNWRLKVNLKSMYESCKRDIKDNKV